MRVLGVDPGGTTGLAIVDSDDWSVESMQLDQPAAFRWLYSCIVLELSNVDAVAIERYVVTARTARFSQQPTALEVIGATKAFCQFAEVGIELQAPADAKTAWFDDRLKAAGLWVAGTHARDATRHAAFFLQRHGIVPPNAGEMTGRREETGEQTWPPGRPR